LIDSPSPANADYITAADAIVIEDISVIVAVHHNAATLATRAQMAETEEYQDATVIEITDPGDSAWEIGQIVSVREYEAEKKKLDALAAAEIRSLTGTTPVTMTRLKYPDLIVLDKDYTRTVVADLAAGHAIPDLVRVEPDVQPVETQKTAIICPECYLETDTVIWGVHKK